MGCSSSGSKRKEMTVESYERALNMRKETNRKKKMEDGPKQIEAKVVLLGDSGVGKSSIS